MDYAKKHDIPIPVTRDKPYSSDRNLLHISYEGGILEDPWLEPDESMFTLSVAPESAPDNAEYVIVDFEDGTPTAVDGEPLSPAALLARVNEMGGRHGVGRVDMVENRYIGMKSRGVYETPGGTILHMAHRAVESLTMDREVMHLRDSLVPRFSELIYNGYWFSPEMDWLRKCIDETQHGVTGSAKIKLFKGHCSVAGRKAPKAASLYVPDFATFEEESVFDQADSTGFIKVNALRLRINALIKGRQKS
jgi:argininosuccinate synthase